MGTPPVLPERFGPNIPEVSPSGFKFQLQDEEAMFFVPALIMQACSVLCVYAPSGPTSVPGSGPAPVNGAASVPVAGTEGACSRRSASSVAFVAAKARRLSQRASTYPFQSPSPAGCLLFLIHPSMSALVYSPPKWPSSSP